MATITTELIRTKQDERGRRITSAAEREALIQAYTQSGLTQKAFAQREGIKYPTLVSWIQASGRRQTPPPPVGFAEVTMARATAPMEVQLPDGTVIRGGNAQDIARILQLVRC